METRNTPLFLPSCPDSLLSPYTGKKTLCHQMMPDAHQQQFSALRLVWKVHQLTLNPMIYLPPLKFPAFLNVVSQTYDLYLSSERGHMSRKPEPGVLSTACLVVSRNHQNSPTFETCACKPSSHTALAWGGAGSPVSDQGNRKSLSRQLDGWVNKGLEGVSSYLCVTFKFPFSFS